jgi:hypothetical protein
VEGRGSPAQSWRGGDDPLASELGLVGGNMALGPEL